MTATRNLPCLAAAALVALLANGCTYSVMYVVKNQAEQELGCDCAPMKLDDITLEVKEEAANVYPGDTRRFYHASCCGREVYYECHLYTHDTLTRRIPPLATQERAGEVYWRCWNTANPLVDEAERRAQALAREDRWYRWSLKGVPGGYLHITRKTKAGSAPVEHTFVLRVRWRGKQVGMQMTVLSREDETLTPVSISSVGEGDDEFPSFDAEIDWLEGGTGRLEAKVAGHGMVEKELPPRTVVDLTLFELVRRLPFEPDRAFKFHSLEASELNLKKDHQLLYRGIEAVGIDGEPVQLHRFEQTGGGISPCQYWVDEEHRLVRVLMDDSKEFLLTTEEAARSALRPAEGGESISPQG